MIRIIMINGGRSICWSSLSKIARQSDEKYRSLTYHDRLSYSRWRRTDFRWLWQQLMMMMMIGLISDKIPFQRYARCAKRAQAFSDTWWSTRIRTQSAADFGTAQLLAWWTTMQVSCGAWAKQSLMTSGLTLFPVLDRPIVHHNQWKHLPIQSV